MPKSFDIPNFYRSDVVSRIKEGRRAGDQRKKDLSPTVIDLGPVRFKLARHFGLCFGVENAIEIAYRALDENPDKRIFLLSEMIHNPHVNKDLTDRGINFLQDTSGNEIISFDELRSDDIVIVPAFGTSLEIFAKLEKLGIDVRRYNATCPFVEKVWKRAAQLGSKGYGIVIHGKHSHEETRATFSHARSAAASVVVRDMEETELLCEFIEGTRELGDFMQHFSERVSEGFNPEEDLQRLGVVNQTTMLAEETRAISERIRLALERRYGSESLSEHFADTRDTLCYATSENQSATQALVATGGDVALIVGGYNSSNTSHLVELCAEHVPAFFIKDAAEILSSSKIRHLDIHSYEVRETENWLPKKAPVEFLVTAGASCPDSLVDQVMLRVCEFFGLERELSESVDLSLVKPAPSSLSVLGQ